LKKEKPKETLFHQLHLLEYFLRHEVGLMDDTFILEILADLCGRNPLYLLRFASKLPESRQDVIGRPGLKGCCIALIRAHE